MPTAFEQLVSAIAARPSIGLPLGPHATADAMQAAGAAQRIAAYRRYLAAARAEKAKRGTAGATIDDVVRTQAHAARDDARTLATTTVRIARQMYVAGDLHAAIDGVTAAMPAIGRVTFDELVANAFAAPPVAAQIAAMGFSTADIDDLKDTLRRAQLSLAVDGGAVVVEQFASDPQRRRATPVTTAAPARTSGRRVVRPDRFLALAQAFEANPDQLRLETVRDAGTTMDTITSLMLGPVALTRMFDAHVRKLDDVGLAMYAGGDPAVIGVVLIVVAAILLLLALILHLAGHDAIAKFLAFLGIVALGIGLCLAGAPIDINGTPAPGCLVVGVIVVVLALKLVDGSG